MMHFPFPRIFAVASVVLVSATVPLSRADDVPSASVQGAAVCGEMETGLAAVKRAEQASDERRWLAALVDWDAAESGLREAINRCPAHVESARAALAPIAARKVEAEHGIHLTVCHPAINKAFALDNKAAKLQLEKKDWVDIERLFGQAEAAWGEAASVCKDDSRALALSNKADSARARGKAAMLLGDGANCEPAYVDASRMLDLAKAAWGERQWEDAGVWYRKAELAWGLAAEKCMGHKRDLALKKKESAAVDAHNAGHCAPHWEKATGLSGKLKQLAEPEGSQGRIQMHNQAEMAWNDAAFARERGAAPLPVPAAVRPPQAVPASAGYTPAVATASPDVSHSLPSPRVEETLPVVRPPTTPREVVMPAPEAVSPVAPPPIRDPLPSTPSRPPEQLVPVAGEAVPVVSLRAGDTTFSGRFLLDPSRQTLSGVGRVKWDNGNVFDGTLVSGKAEGKGSMSWANGDRFEGDWKNDLQHGTGRMAYANGDHYEGEFAAGYPEGQGRYVFSPSGDRYEGQVRRGKPDGQGSYFWKNGDRFDGSWKNGQKNGPGRYTWLGGQSQEGQYVNDQRVP